MRNQTEMERQEEKQAMIPKSALEALNKLVELAERIPDGPWFTVDHIWLPGPDVPTYVVAGFSDPHIGKPVVDAFMPDDVEDEEAAIAEADAIMEFCAAARNAIPALRSLLEPTEARVEVTYNAKQQAFPASSLQTGGLTKREYMALELHKALVTGWAVEIGLKRTDATFSDHAVTLADSLLADLEKEHD